MTRSKAFALVSFSYVVALVVAVGVVLALRDQHVLVSVAVADGLATVVIFAFGQRYRNSSFYDAYWSVAPVPIAIFWALQPVAVGVSQFRQGVVVGLVLLWSIRLTWNWAQGWSGLDHEDWRYVDLREKSGRAFFLVDLFGIQLFPTALVYAGCLSIFVAVSSGTQLYGWIDLLAAVVTATAIAIEMLADHQMRNFTATKQPGEIMNRGLWAHSRHPNYLGELGFWWGLWLFAVAAAPETWWWTLTGPLAMTLLFKFVSIPLMDERSQARRPGYAEHMQRVPALLPSFGKR